MWFKSTSLWNVSHYIRFLFKSVVIFKPVAFRKKKTNYMLNVLEIIQKTHCIFDFFNYYKWKRIFNIAKRN